jgi:hypothetical protein
MTLPSQDFVFAKKIITSVWNLVQLSLYRPRYEPRSSGDTFRLSGFSDSQHMKVARL